MTHYSADAPLGWVVRGAKDSEEIEEGASRVSKVPVAGPVPTTELVAEESNIGVLFSKAEVSSRLGPTRMRRSVNVVSTVEPWLGVHSEGCLSP
ncbi:hypothetical protein BHE74_00053181 [Ensete ventricosum]|nr:hypothetical protein BHE74_00053181 [Ensete ventricosum]